MAQNKTSDLLTRCIGREIRIPYLFDLCPAWQIRHYPYNTEMEDIVNVWREKYEKSMNSMVMRPIILILIVP